MTLDTNILCIPGERICRADDQHCGGKGTYTRNGYIYATLAGSVKIEQKEDNASVVEVLRKFDQSILPSIGSIVTARVTHINSRFCKCNIICIGDTVLKQTFSGLIRKEDVRATEKDKVEMYKCFRPGDIVLARVISIGDSVSYLLSTAENELGVVVAYNESDVPMVPISWTEMQCPKTYNKEFRKVAKVVSSETVQEALGDVT